MHTEQKKIFEFVLHTFVCLFALKLFLLISSLMDPDVPTVDLCARGRAVDDSSCCKADCMHSSWRESYLNWSLRTDFEGELPIHVDGIVTSTFIGTLRQSSDVVSFEVDNELNELSVSLQAEYSSALKGKMSTNCCISAQFFPYISPAGACQMESCCSPSAEPTSAGAVLPVIAVVESSPEGSCFTIALMLWLSSITF